MKRKKPQYEFPVAGVAWTKGAGTPAGVFFLDGRCHLVAESSPAQDELLAQGALHIATVRFDGPVVETTFPGRPVRNLPAHFATPALSAPHRN